MLVIVFGAAKVRASQETAKQLRTLEGIMRVLENRSPFISIKPTGKRLLAFAGAAACAVGVLVGGASGASAASCGQAHAEKMGDHLGVVQSCPKGKQVVYTVECGPLGYPVTTRTATAYFSNSESKFTHISCGNWAKPKIHSVSWEYA